MFGWLKGLLGAGSSNKSPPANKSPGNGVAPADPTVPLKLPSGRGDPDVEPLDNLPTDPVIVPIPAGARPVPKPPGAPRPTTVMKIRSIIGPDTRLALVPFFENLEYESGGSKHVAKVPVAPWSAICCLRLHFGHLTYRGTGWMIGPRTIMTAAHNLHIRHDENFTNRNVDSITVLPGKIGPGDGPYFPKQTKSYAYDLRYATAANDKASGPFDYGAIFLPDDQVGSFVRNFFKFAPVDPNADIGLVGVAGYPKDGQDRLLYAEGDYSRASGGDTRMVVHEVDTEKGQSGAPIYHYHETTGYTVLGIHTDGIGLIANKNAGVRITPELAQRMQTWITNPGAKLDNMFLA